MTSVAAVGALAYVSESLGLGVILTGISLNQDWLQWWHMLIDIRPINCTHFISLREFIDVITNMGFNDQAFKVKSINSLWVCDVYFAACHLWYWHWLLRSWFDIWATGVVGGSGPQQHTGGSNTQPGSMYQEREHQCFSVIYPLQMMPLTFFVITKQAPARLPWRHQRVIDDQQNCVSERVQNYSYVASVSFFCCSHPGIYDLAQHIFNLWACATIRTLFN